MTLVHNITETPGWFASKGINIANTTAKDRRAVVRTVFGSWFADHKLKLTRDYMVDFSADPVRSLSSSLRYEVTARITILNPRAATLFKLTWGGL